MADSPSIPVDVSIAGLAKAKVMADTKMAERRNRKLNRLQEKAKAT